jgi:hypothetical protein
MMGGLAAASILGSQSQAHTSATLAAQAASSATVSVSWTRSQGVWTIVLMAKTSGDSSRGVSGILFRGIHDSFTTQGLLPKQPENAHFRPLFVPYSSLARP